MYREGRPFGDLLEYGKSILEGERFHDAYVAVRRTNCSLVVKT